MLKRAKLVLSIFSFLGVFLSAFTAFAQNPVPAEKSLSPYFYVPNADSSLDALPLKDTSAEVSIAGPIASVTVKQTYKNEGKRPIEAVYTFPASTRAAVNGLKMTIGERVLVAKIEERKKAREQYETAKKEGKSASLLEQQRPNVFQMNVANVMPGDVIQVEMRYSEMLVPEKGTYEFVYPTVVGPRYSNVKELEAAEQDKFVKNPYLHQGEKPNFAFNITTRIHGGTPIDSVACDSHKVKVEYSGKENASVVLASPSENVGNRDFVLRYRLAGKSIQSGLLLYPGEKENFFAITLEPPARPSQSEIVPREYIFVVDVSGSMFGFPLETSKKLLIDLISKLRPTDHFNVLLFAAGTKLMAEKSVPATPQNVEGALAFIGSQQGAGGTELLGALNQAFAIPYLEGVSRTLVLATDGYVSVEKDAFDLVKKSLGQANFFVFGIGSSVNRFLLEGLARAGRGEPFVVLNPAEALERAARFREYIEKPVLTGIQVKFAGAQVSDVVPASYPDVFAERPLVVFGKYEKAMGSVTISGRAGKSEFSKTLQFSPATESADHSSLKFLWARSRISELADVGRVSSEDANRISEITRLGLTYSLLTDYTSFVAVDTVVRNVNGKLETVVQPLPMPEGVSDSAVGGEGSIRTMSMPASMPMFEKATPADSLGVSAPKSKDLPLTMPAVLPKTDPQPAAPLFPSLVVTAIDSVPADVEARVRGAVVLAMSQQTTLGQKALAGTKMRMVIRFDSVGHAVAVRSDKAEFAKFTEVVLKELKGWILYPVPKGKKLRFEIKF